MRGAAGPQARIRTLGGRGWAAGLDRAAQAPIQGAAVVRVGVRLGQARPDPNDLIDPR